MMAHQKCGLSLVPGMEIGYVVRDASEFDADLCEVTGEGMG